MKSSIQFFIGRYDVILEPRKTEDDAITNNTIASDAIIIEFKVHDPEDEKDMHETV